jgi:hypothetical protein
MVALFMCNIVHKKAVAVVAVAIQQPLIVI